jgi:crotonobetainyl-CoA:carnitine CoA-transferase CaiB-like acyl-CoA transferase
MSTEEGREEVRAAIAACDVVVDSSATGLLATAEIDPEVLIAEQPGLVFCEITGLPEESGRRLAPEEWMAAAELGFHRMGKAPEVEPLPILSSYAAIHGALSISAALGLTRATTQSQMIKVSLLAAGMMGLNMRFEKLADASLRESSGKFRLPIADRYACAGDRSLQINGTVPSVARALFAALDHPEWTEEGIDAITAVPTLEDQEAWRQRFADAFIERGAWEWEDLLAQAGAAGTVCRTRREWIDNPHAYATEILEYPTSEIPVPHVGTAVRLYGMGSASQPEHVQTPAPKQRDLPLSGKRVLDLSIIFAGPTAGRLLGELGADVIKIDPPYRSAPPYIGTTPWLDVDRTKRSVLIDLRTSEGKDAMWRLIDSADVILQNFRVGKLERLGFGVDEVLARRPSMVYVSLNAYDFGGPMSDRPGWEPNAQALAGMQAMRGKGGVPPRVPIPVNDFGTGAIGALGTVIALRAVDRTGIGQHVKCSLTRTASFIQTTELTREMLGGTPDARPAWLPTDLTFVETSDGWLTVEDNSTAPQSITELAAELNKRNSAEALEVLDGLGIRAAQARVPEDLLEIPWVESSGLIHWWENRNWGAMRNVFSRPKTSPALTRDGWAAPDPGDDTESMLAELGFSDEEIKTMIAAGGAAGRNPLFQPQSS